jgi:hypothetical protein
MMIATETGLQWDAMKGYGFLPIEVQPERVYDKDYFEKYVGYAGTDLGRAITRSRTGLVLRHAGCVELCDVGIGCGSFVEAFPGFAYLGLTSPAAYGFDVNPVGVAWLRERGLYRDPYTTEFHTLTFWDVLEHIADPAPLLRNAKEWVFASLPIVPGEGPPSTDWKHYKPTEHCWYWTRNGFIEWMYGHGFECVEVNQKESLLGREDVESYAFHRAYRPSSRS